MTKGTIVQRVAAKAVIVDKDGKVLVVREAPEATRSHTGQYQIVGGRVDPGESFEDALHREVLEETGLKVKILQPIYVGEWRPQVQGVQYQIIATFTLCTPLTSTISLSEEHDDYQWVEPLNRKAIDIMVPDCYVVDRVAKLRKQGNL